MLIQPAIVFGVNINYPNFTDLSAFTLNARASQLNTGDGILNLIEGRWQRGSAFLTDRIQLGTTYSTSFSFQISDNVGRGDSDGIGADWIRFSIQTVSDLVPGGNMIGVEFDIYNNGSRDNNSGNHIGLNTDYEDTLQSVAIRHINTRFNNGEVWFSWIDYDGSRVKIYASMNDNKPVDPDISYGLNLADTLGTSEVYLGFIAGSGAGGANFDVLNWSFNSTPIPESGTMILLVTGIIVFVGTRRKIK